MALKIALFAALCVAQAFAFESSFLFGGNVNKVSEAGRDKNFDVIVKCFGEQKENFASVEGRLNRVRAGVYDSLNGELKETAEKYFKALDEPLANFGATMRDVYENLNNRLNGYQMAEAIEVFLTGVQKIEGIFDSMDQDFQKATEEVPELENTFEWLLRWMRYDFDVAKTFMRLKFGECIKN